jgi:hypothetical protein
LNRKALAIAGPFFFALTWPLTWGLGCCILLLL